MPWIIEGDDHIGDDVGDGEEDGEEGERQNSILPDMDVAGIAEEAEAETKPQTAAAASTAAGRGHERRFLVPEIQCKSGSAITAIMTRKGRSTVKNLIL